jgi:hypothetical protein
MFQFPPAEEPPLNRKDVRLQVQAALAWTKARLQEPRPVHNKVLHDRLGQRQSRTGKWLRHQLLVVTRGYWAGGEDKEAHTRSYELNQEGWKHVSKRLKETAPTQRKPGAGIGCKSGEHIKPEGVRLAPNKETGLATRGLDVEPRLAPDTSSWLLPRCCLGVVSLRDAVRVAAELKSLVFTYQEKRPGDRLYHPLQSIERQQLAGLWADRLPFAYDISTAQPTLLMQEAQALGCPDVLLAPISNFLANKVSYRAVAQELLKMSERDAKQCVNGLFFVPVISRSFKCSLYKKHGEAAIAFAEHPLIRPLRKSIQAMWRVLGSRVPVRRAGQKAELARRLERKVLDVVVAHCDALGIKHFLIHDGWRTDKPLDVAVVTAAISKIGFNLVIEGEGNDK